MLFYHRRTGGSSASYCRNCPDLHTTALSTGSLPFWCMAIQEPACCAGGLDQNTSP